MAVIDWKKDAWQLYNDYLENPTSYPIEELLQDRAPVYRRCNMMSRRFKLVYFYDKEKDVVTIMDIWDTRMNPKTLTKKIR